MLLPAGQPIKGEMPGRAHSRSLKALSGLRFRRLFQGDTAEERRIEVVIVKLINVEHLLPQFRVFQSNPAFVL